MDTLQSRLNKFDLWAKKEFAFDRFQWVLDGTLARCGQPYYTSTDGAHTVQPPDVMFLRLKNIVSVISANHYDMEDEGKKRLKDAGIDFHHRPVADFGVPSSEQLRGVAGLIEANRTRKRKPGATLVYCGAGQGRTGTYVAGWVMLKYMANRPYSEGNYTFSFLKDQFGVEREAQAKSISQLVGKPFPNVAMTGNAGSQASSASFARPGTVSSDISW